MAIETVPEWMAGLEDEDLVFIKKFVLASGSLKEMAGEYGVTYPTVRLRLDRLIQKIKLGEDTAADPYIGLIKRLTVNEKLDFDTAKVLISAYKKAKEELQMAMWSVFGIISLLIALISILLPVALVVALQVWLCRRKTRWLGLILPGLSFLFSLLLVFSVGAFGLINQGGSVGTLTLEENGQVIQQTITENGMTTVYDGEGNILDQYPAPDAQEEQNRISMEGLLAVGGIFLVCNIPTVVLGGIWLHYKNRRDFQDEIKKMNIQDLG